MFLQGNGHDFLIKWNRWMRRWGGGGGEKGEERERTDNGMEGKY